MRDNFRPTFYFIFKFCVFVFGWLGLRCFARAFPACSEGGLCFAVVCRLLITVPSLVVEPGLSVRRPRWLRLQALEHRPRSGAQALLP